MEKEPERITAVDEITRVDHIDAKAYASIWAMARLCFGLRKKGLLMEPEIEELFDPP